MLTAKVQLQNVSWFLLVLSLHHRNRENECVALSCTVCISALHCLVFNAWASLRGTQANFVKNGKWLKVVLNYLKL